MIDPRKTKYAEFLEDLIIDIVTHAPDKIGVVALLPGGGALMSYFGECFPADKAIMANQINADVILGIVEANAKSIVKMAAQDDEAEEGDEE